MVSVMVDTVEVVVTSGVVLAVVGSADVVAIVVKVYVVVGNSVVMRSSRDNRSKIIKNKTNFINSFTSTIITTRKWLCFISE